MRRLLVQDWVRTRDATDGLTAPLFVGQNGNVVPVGTLGQVCNCVIGTDRVLVDFGPYGLRWTRARSLEVIDPDDLLAPTV
jgi:hypothetical protein